MASMPQDFKKNKLLYIFLFFIPVEILSHLILIAPIELRRRQMEQR